MASGWFGCGAVRRRRKLSAGARFRVWFHDGGRVAFFPRARILHAALSRPRCPAGAERPARGLDAGDRVALFLRRLVPAEAGIWRQDGVHVRALRVIRILASGRIDRSGRVLIEAGSRPRVCGRMATGMEHRGKMRAIAVPHRARRPYRGGEPDLTQPGIAHMSMPWRRRLFSAAPDLWRERSVGVGARQRRWRSITFHHALCRGSTGYSLVELLGAHARGDRPYRGMAAAPYGCSMLPVF